MKIRFPHAALHVVKTEGFKKAVFYAAKLNPDVPVKEIPKWLSAVIKTNGQPDLLDLYE